MLYAAGFAVALVIVSVMVSRGGTPAMRRTAMAMAANLALVWLAQAATRSYAPWLWFIIIDVGTAFVVLAHPASRPQAAIGAIYVLQIVTHIAFGAAASTEHVRLYLDLLAFGGGCQLLILATGAFHDRGRKAVAVGGGGGGDQGDVAPHPARVEMRP